MEPDERGLLPGEPDPREPSCAYPGCGLPEFVHGKSGHPFRPTPSVEPGLDGALRACEKALPDGWALLMGHDENGEWWATGSEPRDEVHHGYRIVSSSKDGVLYGTAAEALNALAALLPTQASDSPEKP